MNIHEHILVFFLSSTGVISTVIFFITQDSSFLTVGISLIGLSVGLYLGLKSRKV